MDSETAPTTAEVVNQSHSVCWEDKPSRAVLRDMKDAGCSRHIPMPCSSGAPVKTRWIVAADGELPQTHRRGRPITAAMPDHHSLWYLVRAYWSVEFVIFHPYQKGGSEAIYFHLGQRAGDFLQIMITLLLLVTIQSEEILMV